MIRAVFTTGPLLITGVVTMFAFPSMGSESLDLAAAVGASGTDAPTVTIEQNDAEPDPTNTVPFVFDIEFSEDVSDLDVGGVTIGGTATGVVATVSRTGPSTFALTVTSVAGDGTVIPSVNAAAVTDEFDNDNLASTSVDNSITYDATAPSITLIGNIFESVECSDGFTDAGATATDNLDGDLTLSINTGGDTVDTTQVGTYIVTYDVADAAGNDAPQVTRTVEVSDFTQPTLIFPEGQELFLECGSLYTPQAVTAMDACDGDVTSGIFVFGDSVDGSTPGFYAVNYEVQDNSGNVTSEQLTVEVADGQPPVISLVGPASIMLDCQEPYVEQGALVGDACGNANWLVIGGDTVDSSTPGVYVVTYNVDDSEGNVATEVTRTVTVGTGSQCGGVHTADRDSDNVISLSELLRVAQLWNLQAYRCDGTTEDGYAPGPGDQSCPPHDLDYNPQDWRISLSELLRLIQFFVIGGYEDCPSAGTEDGFCPQP